MSYKYNTPIISATVIDRIIFYSKLLVIFSVSLPMIILRMVLMKVIARQKIERSLLREDAIANDIPIKELEKKVSHNKSNFLHPKSSTTEARNKSDIIFIQHEDAK